MDGGEKSPLRPADGLDFVRWQTLRSISRAGASFSFVEVLVLFGGARGQRLERDHEGAARAILLEKKRDEPLS